MPQPVQRFACIVAEHRVTVDDVTVTLDLRALQELGIRFIQWDATRADVRFIEYDDDRRAVMTAPESNDLTSWIVAGVRHNVEQAQLMKQREAKRREDEAAAEQRKREDERRDQQAKAEAEDKERRERYEASLTYADRRAASYPGIGAQLDALWKLAVRLRDRGVPLPDDAAAMLDVIGAVKAAHPKPAAPNPEPPPAPVPAEPKALTPPAPARRRAAPRPVRLRKKA